MSGTVTIHAAHLELGHTIVEGGSKDTVVRQIDTTRCRNHIHINERMCYDNVAEVRIRDTKRTDVEGAEISTPTIPDGGYSDVHSSGDGDHIAQDYADSRL